MDGTFGRFMMCDISSYFLTSIKDDGGGKKNEHLLDIAWFLAFVMNNYKEMANQTSTYVALIMLKASVFY
jgi:hypothetical protein